MLEVVMRNDGHLVIFEKNILDLKADMCFICHNQKWQKLVQKLESSVQQLTCPGKIHRLEYETRWVGRIRFQSPRRTQRATWDISRATFDRLVWKGDLWCFEGNNNFKVNKCQNNFKVKQNTYKNPLKFGQNRTSTAVKLPVKSWHLGER